MRNGPLPYLLHIRHYGEVANDAMRQQYQRLGKNPPRLYDGYLFAVALADLLRAAGEAKKQTHRSAIEVAMEAIPRAKDFRNVLEHWPEYARGKGRDAKRLGLSPDGNWFWWKTTSPLVLRIGGSRSGLELDVEQAKTAGDQLYQILHVALETAIAQRLLNKGEGDEAR